LQILTTKPKWKASVRLLEVGSLDTPSSAWQFRAIEGGFLYQQADNRPDPESQWKVVTKRRPTEDQIADLKFAWALVRHVKSNAITLAADQMLVGVGAGQMSRVDSVEIASRKAGKRAVGSVMASDAFFPFADSVEMAAAAGVRAIIQPGGSRRDDESIAACDAVSMPMIFTNYRHFKH
jgi:phosphoribosylaminoimidazolecarboxamide formyltransferase/IMP cyclohydrolase